MSDRGGRGRGRGGAPRGRGGGDRGDRGGYGGRGGRGGGTGGGRGAGAPSGGRGRGQEAPQMFSYEGHPAPQPSAEVERLENAIMSGASKAPSKPEDLPVGGLKLDVGQQPARPGFGSKGTVVELWANYFELQVDRKVTFFRYHIEIIPRKGGKERGQDNGPKGKKLQRLVQILLTDNSVFSSRAAESATNYKDALIVKERLPDEEIAEPFHVTYRNELEDNPAPNALSYSIKVTYRAAHSLGDLIDYVTSTRISAAHLDRDDTVASLNIIMRNLAWRLSSMKVIGGAKTFDVERAPRFDLGSGLTALRGFFSSVRLATSRVLLNVNVSHAAFFTEGRLDALIQAYGNQGVNNIEKFLRLLRVQTTHLPERRNAQGTVIPRIKTIMTLARVRDGGPTVRVHRDGGGAKEVEFWLDAEDGRPARTPEKIGKKRKPAAGPATPATGGRFITVYDFFRNTYGIEIQNPALPVVNVGNRQNPVFLPAQVCDVLSGQTYQRKLGPDQTAQMINFAVRRPHQNLQSITFAGPRQNGFTDPIDRVLEKFQIGIGSQLVTVRGRVLTGPNVYYQDRNQDKRVTPMYGSWNMQSIKFQDARQMPIWTFIRVTSRRSNGAFQGHPALPQQMRRLQQELANVGIRVGPSQPGREVFVPPAPPLHSRDTSELEGMLRALAKDRIAFVICVLPDADERVYNVVKQLCDLELGLNSLCVLEPTLKKQLDRQTGEPMGSKEKQLFANLALKINLKLGGTNQKVDPNAMPLLKQSRTMLVGLDVTHPSPGSSKRAPSVAGMVANIDSSLGQWPAIVRVQTAKREMVDGLEEMFISRLDLWRTMGKNPKLPENILVYRDGVSEGQYELVREVELSALQKACARKYPKADRDKNLPRITIVVVGKRHHTRFYPTKDEYSDGRTGNCKPGTVVDRGITEARNWDFFLQAHTALQGTARPAHYYVIYDEIFTGRKKDPMFKGPGAAQGRDPADTIEEMTLAMSHVFGRATKVISTATPARYADMVCDRARVYLDTLYDPTDTTETGSVSATSSAADPPLPQIRLHTNLVNTMFYV